MKHRQINRDRKLEPVGVWQSRTATDEAYDAGWRDASWLWFGATVTFTVLACCVVYAVTS